MTYRFPRGLLVALVVAFVLVAVVLSAWDGRAGAGFAVLVVPLVVYLGRSATVVTDDGVRVRGLLRSRLARWPEIVELRIERTRSQMNPTVDVVVLYTASTRRVLTYVNDFRLPDDGQLATELAGLRERWVRHRGPGWTSRPEALDRHAVRGDAWEFGVQTMWLSALLFAGSYEVLTFVTPRNPMSAWWILAGPVLVTAVAVVVGKLVGRRR